MRTIDEPLPLEIAGRKDNFRPAIGRGTMTLMVQSVLIFMSRLSSKGSLISRLVIDREEHRDMGLMGAAAVIVNEAGEVLLVKHTYGKCNWEIPGGRSEEGESPVDTAIREVREETGLAVVAQHMTGYYFDAGTGGLHFVFRCEVQEGADGAMPDGAEVSACRYWSPDSLPRPISDFTVLRIHDALAGRMFPLPTTIGPRQWLEEP